MHSIIYLTASLENKSRGKMKKRGKGLFFYYFVFKKMLCVCSCEVNFLNTTNISLRCWGTYTNKKVCIYWEIFCRPLLHSHLCSQLRHRISSSQCWDNPRVRLTYFSLHSICVQWLLGPQAAVKGGSGGSLQQQ